MPLTQWLASLLLGALNIEQTKYLNCDDLELILGHYTRTLRTQRQRLYTLATTSDAIGALLRWNYTQLAPAEQSCDDFYLDPHTQHYTGSQNVLKGWCAAIRWADKLINSDYIHTAAGSPIYFECGDNYEDLRTRLHPLLKRLRSTLEWESERTLTFVIDRGIYGNEVFSQIAKDPQHHLITWEKNYSSAPWPVSQATGSSVIEKSYNCASKTRRYEFHWKEQPWAKNTLLRQIEVRAVNPSGNIAHVAILTDAPTRACSQIVSLMFNRWVQENDFKYLDKHFGINQITSYRSDPYEEIRESLSDRQVPNHQWQAKYRKYRELQKHKARLLAAQDQAKRREQERQQRIGKLEQSLQNAAGRATSSGPNDEGQSNSQHAQASLQRELREQRQSSERYQRYERQRVERIEQVHGELEANQAERASIEKTVSRIDQVISEEMVRLDTSSKSLMDTLRIIGRNAFYRSLSGFKEAYDNYRDDHGHWRELTQSAGVVHVTAERIEVYLLPRVNYGPKLRELVSKELEKHNNQHWELKDGSKRELVVKLGQRDGIEVRLPSNESRQED